MFVYNSNKQSRLFEMSHIRLLAAIRECQFSCVLKKIVPNICVHNVLYKAANAQTITKEKVLPLICRQDATSDVHRSNSNLDESSQYKTVVMQHPFQT